MIDNLNSPLDHEPASSGLRLDTDTISIGDILENYDNWGVPHFQRGSVWGADNISALLESLYHDTPCGSIILWTPKDIDASGVPLVSGSKCSHLIIDGQQRTRSVYAAFKGLFDITQASVETDDGQHSEDSTDGAERHWAINLCEVAEFDTLLHRPEKRLWPLFVPVPDAYLAEHNRQQAMAKRKADGKVRYTIPESPFKYNFVPLHHFISGDLETALKQGRLFIKRNDGQTDCTGNDLASIVLQLERLRFKVQQMKTRRLFRKVLGEHIALDGALRVFIRINSGGRPVQMEEKGFSILVGRAPSTSHWVKTIFDRVHGHQDPSGPGIERDSAMKRMNERSFGFKLFIRVFLLTTSYHTGRAIGARSLSFAALTDRRFLTMLDGDRAAYEQLWSVTADVVVAVRNVLENRLKLDALQFLPETTSLFPLFLGLIKFPGLMENTGTDSVRVRHEFEAGIARLALLLLLRDLKTREVMSRANDVANTQEDATTLLERLGSELTVEAAFLAKPLQGANSLTNRYTLLLYGLQRSRNARDFNYVANKLTKPEFGQVERPLNRSCEPEKQHIVPYSHLIDAYNLESASRVSSTPANNIGNMTYISHAENSLGGLSDALMELSKEDAENTRAHFVGASLQTFELVKVFIEAGNATQTDELKRLYEGWIEGRQAEIAKGFLSWVVDLQQEWLEKSDQRKERTRIEAARPYVDPVGGGLALAHCIRALGVADAIEDALIKIFAVDGWVLKGNGNAPESESHLTLSLRRKRRNIIKDVVVSPRRLTVPRGPDGIPQTIEFGDSALGAEQLTRLSEFFDNCEAPSTKQSGKIAGGDGKDGMARKRRKVGRAELLDEIGKAGADARRTAEALVASAKELGAFVSFGDASVSVRVRNAATKKPCTLFVLTRKATFYIGFLSYWELNAGVEPEVGAAYNADLTKILGRSPLVDSSDWEGAGAMPLAQIEPCLDRILAAVRSRAALLKIAKPAAAPALINTPLV